MISENLHILTNHAPLAYLDGGSGSLIFQMLVASSVTAIFAIKTRWQVLMASVAKLRNRNSSQ